MTKKKTRMGYRGVPMHVLSVNLPAVVVAAIEKLADEQLTTRQAQITTALREYLEKRKRWPAMDPAPRMQ